MEIIEVYGKDDPFLTEAKIAEMKMLADKLEIKLAPIVFEGGHEINKATLAKLI